MGDEMTRTKSIVSRILPNHEGNPFVFEVFKGDREHTENNLFLMRGEEDVVVRYDGNDQQEYLLAAFLKSAYERFKLEAPSISMALGMGMTKISLGISSLVFPVIAPILSIISAGITLHELDSDVQVKKNKEAYAVKVLKKLKENEEVLETPEGLLLASINLLIEISHLHKVVIHIEHAEKLKSIDIQFLRIFYSLYKDKLSKVQLDSMVPKSLRSSNGEAKSYLLTILHWNVDDAKELDHFTKKEDLSDDIKQLAEFRWFLYRYRMASSLQTTSPPLVVNHDIFIGREDLLQDLEEEIKRVRAERTFIASKIKAPAGTGKTSLSTQLINQIYSDLGEVEYIYTSFGGEYSELRESLYELRNTLQFLKLKIDPSIRKKIENLLKYDSNERLKLFADIFDGTATTDSFLSLVTSLLGIPINSVVDILKTSIFAAKDGIAAIKDTRSGKKKSSYQVDVNRMIQVSSSQVSLQEVIEQLVEEYIALLLTSLTEKNNKTLIWVVDDTQWMDLGTAHFFEALFKELNNRSFPLYILFLERPEAATSRNELMNLSPYFSSVIPLDGFKRGEFQNLLEKSIAIYEDTTEITASVAALMWDWFCNQENKESIEPLFIVEFINLLTYYPDIIHERDTGWSWASPNKFIIINELTSILKRWSENNLVNTTFSDSKQFTANTLAVMNERMYQISKNFSEGYQLLTFLQLSAFFGEPFQPGLVNKLQVENAITEFQLKECEITYNILIEHYSDSPWVSYLFSHALYYEYLLIRFKLFCTTSLEEQHFQVYNILKNELEGNLIDSKRNPEHLLLLAANHGLLSRKQKAMIQAAYYFGVLAESALQKSNYTKLFEYADKAKSITDQFFRPEHPFSHKIINLMVIAHKAVGDITVALTYLNDQFAGIEWARKKGLKSADNINPLQLVISYTLRSEILIDTVFQLSDLEFMTYKRSKLEVVKEAKIDIQHALTLLKKLNLKKYHEIEAHISNAHHTRGKIYRYELEQGMLYPDICVQEYETAIHYMTLAAEKNDFYKISLFVLHKELAYIQQDIFSLIVLMKYKQVNVDTIGNEGVVTLFHIMTNEKIIPKLNKALDIAQNLEQERKFNFPNAILFDFRNRASCYVRVRNFPEAEREINLVFARANELLASGRLNKTGTSMLTLTHLLAAKLSLLKWCNGFDWNYDYFERNLLKAAHYADELHKIEYLQFQTEIQHTIDCITRELGLEAQAGEYYKRLHEYKEFFKQRIYLENIDRILTKFHFYI
ncbi:hypothetical protein CA598_20970 [Paenibacillus sp. VTT E-133291]|nr:hypothetical protein CA598_20970 [Paenibacillus sp. VTT E-133291]